MLFHLFFSVVVPLRQGTDFSLSLDSQPPSLTIPISVSISQSPSRFPSVAGYHLQLYIIVSLLHGLKLAVQLRWSLRNLVLSLMQSVPSMEEDLSGASPCPSHWWWFLCLLNDVMLPFFFLCPFEYFKLFSHIGIFLPTGSDGGTLYWSLSNGNNNQKLTSYTLFSQAGMETGSPGTFLCYIT